jgi:sensor histidine kinase YesM
MQNPFDESEEVSIDEFNTSLPICFGEVTGGDLLKCKGSELSSPIAIIDLDRLSEKFSNGDANEGELRSSLKQAQMMLKEVKTYTESLEQRNLEMALELEKERMRSKQLLNTLTFLKNSLEERNQAEEQKTSNNNDLSSRYVL